MASILLLILLLLVAGTMSILEFRKMADSVEEVMDNNYRSIESSKKMLDAVERQDSGILMWLLGNKSEGEETISRSDSIIHQALEETKNNITEANEEEHILKIQEEYAEFHSAVKNVLDSAGLNEHGTAYSPTLEASFIDTKNAINNLMMLNQNQMYQQSAVLKANSKRAMMPTLVAIAAAIVFVLLLNLFIIIYFINPVQRTIDSVKEYYPEKGRINANIHSKDEMKLLEDEINRMIVRLQRKTNVK